MLKTLLAIAWVFSGVAANAALDVAAIPADNSKLNQTRAEENLPSADDASQTDADVRLSAVIRKDLIGRRALSTYAKNVKIIVREGNVRLAGPVRSEKEKQIVVGAAVANAPNFKVIDELSVVQYKK